MQERLQKILAAAGYGSRRECENIVAAGRVRVNGLTISELGTKADPARDDISVDGRKIERVKHEYIALNKPRGYASTRKDPHAKKTVMELLPDRFQKLYPVGRLDVPSEGLMLFTNDGEMTDRLTHPRYSVPKMYRVTVIGIMTAASIRRIREGVNLEDGPTAPAHATIISKDTVRGRSRVEVALGEGRKHEVRRIFETLGYQVNRLVRVRIGPITLSGLKPGEWRPLSEEEMEALFQLKIQMPPAPHPELRPRALGQRQGPGHWRRISYRKGRPRE